MQFLHVHTRVASSTRLSTGLAPQRVGCVRPALLAALLLAAGGSAPAGEPTPARLPRSSGKQVVYEDAGPAAIERARCALETLRKQVEEWGTLTVSEPLVVLDAGQFSLSRDNPTFEGADAYIARARGAVQGAATQVEGRTLTNGLNVDVQPNFSIDLSGTKIAGPTPNPSPLSAPTPDATPDTNPTPGALLRIVAGTPKSGTPSSFALSDSVAVPVGESAKITELLGRAMSHPTDSVFANPDVTVHFAIVQISCNPGWRTRENYVGDVTANCEFYRSHGGGVQTEDDQVRPLVFSVLPLFDAQTLELASAQRDVAQLITQLSAAYPTSVANLRASDLLKLARQFQSDVATRTPRTVTNSYSTGSCFGFRFAPSLVALKDPAQRHSGAANVLQATSFPALVTIVVNQRHAHEAGFDSVLVHITHRWLVNDRPPLRTFWRRWTTPLKRDAVDDEFEVARAADQAHDAVYSLPGIREGEVSPRTPATAAMLYRQFLELRAKAIGTSRPVFSFPWSGGARRTGGPRIGDVNPRRIAPTGEVALVVRGFRFSGDVAQYEVWLGQRRGDVLMVKPNALEGDRLFVKFRAPTLNDPAMPLDGTLPLIIKGPNGIDVKTDAVEIIRPVVEHNALSPKDKAAAGVATAAPTPTPAPGAGSLFPGPDAAQVVLSDRRSDLPAPQMDAASDLPTP